MNCRTCAESDVIDRELDMHLCTKYGETVGGNNSCNEWVEEDRGECGEQ